MKIQKTQIAWVAGHPFAFVWLPIRQVKGRPAVYIVVSFCLRRLIDSPRIVEAVEPRPNRWTHHVIVQSPQEIDGELLDWIQEAAVQGGS